MFRRHRELWYSLAVIVAVTAVYALAYVQSSTFPRASGLLGHWIGIVGFVLMLTTEVAYSIRKRLTDARWGRMENWLTFHMVTGITGPYMVLLHTSMKFQGVAGVAMLLTVIVVGSGLVGRYLYTRARQAEDGRRSALARWYAVHVPLTWALFVTAAVHAAAALYYVTLQR